MTEGKKPLRTPLAKRDELNDRLAEGQRAAVPRPAVPPPTKAGVVQAEILAAQHRDAATEAKRQQSESNLEAARTTAAFIIHNEKIEQKQGDLAVAVSLLAREHGIEHLLPLSLQGSIPPPKGARQRRGFARLSRESRAIAVLFVLVQLFHEDLVALFRAAFLAILHLL